MSRYLTVADVAEELRETEDNVRRRCAAGQIPARKVGHRWLVDSDDFKAFMKPSKVAVKSPRSRLSARQKRRRSA